MMIGKVVVFVIVVVYSRALTRRVESQTTSLRPSHSESEVVQALVVACRVHLQLLEPQIHTKRAYC